MPRYDPGGPQALGGSMSTMKVGLYRVASIPTEHLYGAVGAAEGTTSEKAEAALRQRFGPHLPPGLKIFWNDRRTVVGVEVMNFSLTHAAVPMAGLAQADPISPTAINRVDGALESELKRWGIWTKPEDYEWRMAYEGNLGRDQDPSLEYARAVLGGPFGHD